MNPTVPQIGLALGGGGARGLAHIKILQVLDEFAIKPQAIAGTSMGALVGSLYAAGMTGLEIEDYAVESFSKRTELLKRLYGKRPPKWTTLFNFTTPAILNAETFFEMIMPAELPKSFEDLQIPLHAVTTDFYTQEIFVINKGPLYPALAASSALPALLTPVEIADRVLIDGGFVNPLPYDVIKDDVDITIAVDVTGEPARLAGKIPGSVGALIGASQIMLRSLTNAMIKNHKPDILIAPKVGRYNVLDYFKIKDILADSEQAADQLRSDLEAILGQPVPREIEIG